MTIEKERERRANQIVRNADIYSYDDDFRRMVDSTVYLTPDQKEKAQLAVDAVYGSCIDAFREIESRREYGA